MVVEMEDDDYCISELQSGELSSHKGSSLLEGMSAMSSSSPQMVVEMEEDDYSISALHSEELSSHDEDDDDYDDAVLEP